MTNDVADNRGVDVERTLALIANKLEYGLWTKAKAADEIDKVLKILRTTPEDAKGDVCPTCSGDGWTVEVQPACCGRGSESGDCCGIPIPEQVQEQCGHCYGSGVIAQQPEHEGE